MEIKMPNLKDVKEVLPETTTNIDKATSLIVRTLKAAFAPVEKWVLYREYSVKEVEIILQEKLKNIPPEKIVEPELYVAVPALQAMSYCMDSEILRERFANLLANAMNVDTKEDVHPSFIEIIKQLSPLDAQLLAEFVSNGKISYPICNIVYGESKTKEFIVSVGINEHINIMPNYFISHTLQEDAYKISSSISNLNRLGIIGIVTDSYLTETNVYDDFKENDFIRKIREELIANNINEKRKDFVLYLIKRYFDITLLGKQFLSVCY